MSTEAAPPAGYRGFLVHAWVDQKRDRLYVSGRLEDGRSFAAVDSDSRPVFHLYQNDLDRARRLLARIPHRPLPAELESFEGKEPLVLFEFDRYAARTAALALLEQAGVRIPEAGEKPPAAWLIRRNIRGPVEIRGNGRPGRFMDLVFPRAELGAPDAPVRVALLIASIDIETDTGDGSIRAIGISSADSDFTGIRSLVRVRAPEGAESPPLQESGSGAAFGAAPGRVVFHPDERSLLAAFIADIQTLDPDVLTGWNFLDFDFPRLAGRCEKLGLPFAISRSGEEAKFFAGSTGRAADASASGTREGIPDDGWGSRRRSAAALVPGRQVIDALRIVRFGAFGGGLASFAPFTDFTLQTAAQVILGEGKSVTATGAEKIAELDRLYRADPAAFGEYCGRDAELVLRIFAKTGLFRLTMERASLTGVSLDKAWTSVVTFERIYGLELRRRGIAPPPLSRVPVSGAAGGTILESEPGLFQNVTVFDFRSLYPTIMRTFNIDPLAHERAERIAEQIAEQSTGQPAPFGSAESDGPITAPNGAAFSREAGLLPALITGYFASRRKALDAGDGITASVYKILMNSFYGVLGTGSCRYGRTELAGAITSFARKWLHLSRDWFKEKGCRVLYGDTDSLFVETGRGDGADYGEFAEHGGALAGELNRFLAERIRAEYGLESFLELRFEKVYRRFLIPPLRSVSSATRGAGAADAEPRGRAKGYGGTLLVPEGGAKTEVKGMEAVRSDTTPLARRVQLELLELVFGDGGEAAFIAHVREILKELRAGKLDAELVYRKRLSRPPETYTAATPPQVKAARALGWKGRRGTVEYVWTINGPEPLALATSPYDYEHYTDSQILPVAQSIAAARGWRGELFPEKGRRRAELGSGQMELWSE
jgi:DNA polymerase-2